MKHFYIYLPNGNLFTHTDIIERVDFYHLGQFRTEQKCRDYCRKLLNDTLRANEFILGQLADKRDLKGTTKQPLIDLANVIKTNALLDFQYRQHQL